MSVFTSRITKQIDIPHDPGQSVTIRKIAPRHLEQAAKAQQFQSMSDLRELGGAAFVKELQAIGGEAAVAAARSADPLLGFDRVVLLEKGVLAWSYGEAVGRAAFEDLDETTLQYLASAILRLAKPTLYESLEETAAGRKND